MFKDIDFFPGQITYDDFFINESLSFNEQQFAYKEDLFQVNYNEKLILDIGWYPEFSPEGNFKIIIVKDYNWQEPLYEKRCSEVIKLKMLIKESHKIIQKILLDVTGNKPSYLMQVENVFKLAEGRIVLVGRNTGGIERGDILVDLDNKIKMKVKKINLIEIIVRL